MENSRFSRIYKNLPKIIIFVLVIALLIANVVCVCYIRELEIQIEQRDSIISRLTFSNDLVKEYFDIVEDTVTQRTLYTLKDEKKTKIIQTKTEYVEKPVMVETQFTRGDKVISTEELLSIVNNGDSVYIDKIISLSKQYNSLINDYNAILKEKSSLKDTVIFQGMALGLIKRNYDIDYTSRLDGNNYHIQLEASKADSAFMLFPYFKHKLKYDEKKKSWIIKR